MELLCRGPFYSSPLLVVTQEEGPSLGVKRRVCRNLSIGDERSNTPAVNNFIEKADFPTRFNMAFNVAKTVHGLLVFIAPFPFPPPRFPPRASALVTAHRCIRLLCASAPVPALRCMQFLAHQRPSLHIGAYKSFAHRRSSLCIGTHEFICASAQVHAHRRTVSTSRFGVHYRARARELHLHRPHHLIYPCSTIRDLFFIFGPFRWPKPQQEHKPALSTSRCSTAPA
jgi:hypothetical protein